MAKAKSKTANDNGNAKGKKKKGSKHVSKAERAAKLKERNDATG